MDGGKLRVKLQHELLAWEFHTHHKMALVDHTSRRTQFLLANQGKKAGLTHIVCLWKTKQIKIVQQYLPDSRVFDLCYLREQKQVMVYHIQKKGPLEWSKIDLTFCTVTPAL